MIPRPVVADRGKVCPGTTPTRSLATSRHPRPRSFRPRLSEPRPCNPPFPAPTFLPCPHHISKPLPILTPGFIALAVPAFPLMNSLAEPQPPNQAFMMQSLLCLTPSFIQRCQLGSWKS